MRTYVRVRNRQAPHVSLARRLSMAYVKLNMTRDELAKKIGVPVATYARHEGCCNTEKDVGYFHARFAMVADLFNAEEAAHLRRLEFINDDVVRFGDQLTLERKRLGLSQREMTDKLKMQRSAISAYERYERLPTKAIMSKMISTFNLSPEMIQLIKHLEGLPSQNIGNVGLWMQCHRLDKNMTLQQVARLLGVETPHLSRIETNNRVLTLRFVANMLATGYIDEESMVELMTTIASAPEYQLHCEGYQHAA